MAFNFREMTRDDGYSISSSSEEGKASCVYMLYGVNETTPPTVSQIGEFTTFLCGGVDNVAPGEILHTDTSGGKIKRRLPKTAPMLPELSVAGITKIKGSGTPSDASYLSVLGLTPVTEQFTHFTHYDYVTEFARRPYFLLSDDMIDRPTAAYYPQTDDGTGEGTRIYYAEEWKRYTTTTLTPTPDTINATTGAQMRFRTTGALNGAQFPGQVSVYLQNQVLEMNWFLVPYRYFFRQGVYKPYLTRFVNTVNQNAFLGFEAGQLMFLGATPTPFMPQAVNVPRLLGVGFTQSQSLLCNVKMRWLATTREASDVPVKPAAGLANRNNIAAGHNLQPSFTDRKFHYVSTEDPTDALNETKWRSAFPSFPHELLFTDPMLKQPSGVI